MKSTRTYSLLLLAVALVVTHARPGIAGPSRKGQSQSQRGTKSSYKSPNRANNAKSSRASQTQKKYRSPAKVNYPSRRPATTKQGGRVTTHSRPNVKDHKYTIDPRRGNKGRDYTIDPRRGNKGHDYTIDPRRGNKGGKDIPSIIGPFVPKPGGKDKPWYTGPFVPKPGDKGKPPRTKPFVPKPIGPCLPIPGGKDKPWEAGKDKPWITGPFVPKPSDKDITGPFLPKPGAGGLNPKDLKPLPKIDDLSKGLKDFWKKGNKNNNQADLMKVKAFANKCIGFPAPCDWWVDFCCWNWWDWCCHPGYWNCWDPCHWHYVYCPSRVVVVNGVEQVLEEVSYYLGISGSQIPSLGFGIQEVKVASPAERAGLKQGDIIVTVNARQMTGEDVLATAMQQADGVLNLEIISQGSDMPRSVRVIAERIRTSSF